MKYSMRTINNAVFNVISWIIPIIFSLVFLPYIVHKIGDEEYGILTLILTVIGYFSILDLGLENAVIKYVAEYNAEGNTKKTNDVIQTTFLIYIFLGLFGGVILFSISGILVKYFLKIPPELISDAYTAFCLGAIGLLSLF